MTKTNILKNVFLLSRQASSKSSTATCESKVQRALRKLKFKFTEREYYQLYPNGSNVGKFYGTAKVHKLKQGDTVDQLPLQPIVSNSGTAKLLSSLIKISQYTVQNTKEFINHIKKQKVPSNYKMISFDVISLFTNVPRDATIYIVLKRIYEWKEINTSFTKQELKELILLCTKGVQFTLRGESYIQTDGRTRKHFSSNIIKSCYSWKQYVDDTNRFTK